MENGGEILYHFILILANIWGANGFYDSRYKILCGLGYVVVGMLSYKTLILLGIY